MGKLSVILILLVILMAGYDKDSTPASAVCGDCHPYERCDFSKGICIQNENYCESDGDCTSDLKVCDQRQHSCIFKSNVCEYLKCSGHGVCNDRDAEKVVCDCDEGYVRTSDQLGCVSKTVKDQVCGGITCGDRGNCELNQMKAPLCICNDGYRVDSENQLNCIKQEEKPLIPGDLGDPCNYKESLRTGESATCRYGICVYEGYCSKRCAENSDCGEQFFCAKDFYDDPGQCKKIPEGCEDQAVAKVYEACDVTCGDAGCESGTGCIGGRCIPFCESDNECSRFVNYEKDQCGEKSGNTDGRFTYCNFLGGWYGYCELAEPDCSEIKRSVGLFEPCNSRCGDGDCASGMCVGGICSSSCSGTDAPCGADGYCYLNDHCQPVKSGCQKRSVALWGSCDLNCKSSDCPGGSYCGNTGNGGICIPLCDDDDECTALESNQLKLYCSKTPGYIGLCQPYEGDFICKGMKKAFETCHTACGNKDCAGDLFCSPIEERCLPKCSGLSDISCPEGTHCRGMNNGFYCTEKICLGEGDCHEGESCGYDEALSPADINYEDAFVGICKENGDLKKYGEHCSSNSQCGSGICLNNRCSKACSRSDQCTTDGEYCLRKQHINEYDNPVYRTLCVDPLSSEGKRILGKTFRGICDQSGGCPGTSRCKPVPVTSIPLSSDDIEYFCLDDQLTGDRQEDQACTKDQQCESGICYSRYKKCIKTGVALNEACSKDSDCASGLCNTILRQCIASKTVEKGGVCELDIECISGNCVNGICGDLKKLMGEGCCDHQSCLSGICNNFICTDYCDSDQNCSAGLRCKQSGLYRYCQ